MPSSKQKSEEWFQTGYAERWRLMYEGLLPEKIKIFGRTLTRKEYLVISGLILLSFIALGTWLNRRTIRKEIDKYYSENVEMPEP